MKDRAIPGQRHTDYNPQPLHMLSEILSGTKAVDLSHPRFAPGEEQEMKEIFEYGIPAPGLLCFLWGGRGPGFPEK